MDKIPTDDKRSVNPNFITHIIDDDLKTGKVQEVVTRWPPEPNGYMHLGHAKSVLLNFGIARDYGGRYRLRMDDTNPTKEDMEFVHAFVKDISWLGFEVEQQLVFASDYFERLYDMALQLIRAGIAYVDSLDEEAMRAYRGTVTEPGTASPFRERSVAENLDLFERMNQGEFAEGEHTLRAKIDMANPNMKLRDPVLYRILHSEHYRKGDRWKVYPMYDFAHPLSDAIEGVTHSMCTLEFIDNRAVYDWLVKHLCSEPRPHQYEFGRHNIDYTVMGKRNLIRLVKEGYVKGWDDPRMPTISALRRRGVTPDAIHDFVNRLGVTKTNTSVSIGLLEHSVRDDLNTKAPRVMAVLEPLRVVLTNYPEDKLEQLESPYWPRDVAKEGSRLVPFGRELYIERSDFSEDPPEGFYRLRPGGEVRLRRAYVIYCDQVIKDDSGKVVALHCRYDATTLGHNPSDRKVKGAIHWVAVREAVPAEFRLIDRLFTVPQADRMTEPFTHYLNPESLLVKRGFVEPSVRHDAPDTPYQFERQGYFIQDAIDSKPEALVFNRTVTLRDSWAKEQAEESLTERTVVTSIQTQENRDPAEAFDTAQREQLAAYLAQGISYNDAVILVEHSDLAAFFYQTSRHVQNPVEIAKWLTNEVLREIRGEAFALQPVQLAELITLVTDEIISSRAAKDVFTELLKGDKTAAEIVASKGLEQISDRARLEAVIEQLMTDNADKVEAYRQGKTGLSSFFVGQVMRATQGKANPQLVAQLVSEKLSG